MCTSNKMQTTESVPEFVVPVTSHESLITEARSGGGGHRGQVGGGTHRPGQGWVTYAVLIKTTNTIITKSIKWNRFISLLLGQFNRLTKLKCEWSSNSRSLDQVSININT